MCRLQRLNRFASAAGSDRGIIRGAAGAEYGYEAEVGEAPVAEPEAPTGLFNDPSFNEALAFADAAIEAAEVDEMPAPWPHVEKPMPTHGHRSRAGVEA